MTELEPKTNLRTRMARRRRATNPERPDPAGSSWFMLATLAMVFLVAFLFLMFGGGLVAYASIASTLPPPDELTVRSAAFLTTRIYDRDGELLNEAFDPGGGRRTLVRLHDISPHLINATLATEDANFYEHPGIDPVGLGRAIMQAVREREFVSGGSTIPQQLVKNVFLTPERTVNRKIREAILAAEITRRYPRDTILEIYLNEIYYGNLAYGIEAAANTYFGKPAADLTLAEAALLAGLPQLPSVYDPYTKPEAAKNRQAVVLGLMVRHGYITPAEADAAWAEPLRYVPPRFDLRAPHFVMYVREQLEKQYGPEVVYRGGLQVYTTIDSELHEQAQGIAARQVEQLADREVSNAAVVVLEPQTGEILAMVGSIDFNNTEIDGQVNVTTRIRSPGSALKPFTYLATFEHEPDGWTPGTLVPDIETEFPDGPNPPYVPTNFDNRERGLVTVRDGLGNSLNIPAVHALDFVGIEALKELAPRMGIDSLTRPDYGLSLTLGGGDVTLLELTRAYAVLANEGRMVVPTAIVRVEDAEGNVIQEHSSNDNEQVVRADHAFLITDMLRDNEARSLIFGPNSVLNFPRPAGVKTGTSNEFRDSWAAGYTPQRAVGVWVGNNDNRPMRNVSGVAGAGPIWREVLELAVQELPADDFTVPAGIEFFEVCQDTGTLPSEACPETRVHPFAADRPPLGAEHDLHQLIPIDRNSGHRATEFTPAEHVELRYFKVYPPEYREWAEANGIPQPPPELPDDFAPQVAIFLPEPDEAVQGVVTISGRANAPDFDHYIIEYGVSHAPGAFGHVSGPHHEPVDGGVLGNWDTAGLNEGPHTVRLLVFDRHGSVYETRVHVHVVAPEPADTPTPEPTETATPTPTAAEPTPTPTATPVIESTPTPTATPTELVPTPVTEPTPTPTVVLAALQARIDRPQQDEVVAQEVRIEGVAAGPTFQHYRLEYSFVGEAEVGEWRPVDPERARYETAVESSGLLGVWPTAELLPGPYTLRLTVVGQDGQEAGARVRVFVGG